MARPKTSFTPPLCISAGDYDDELTVIHKFGFNNAVGTTMVPISSNGVYRTPQVAGATALRIKAGGDANDTAAGSGAREVTLQGLDETGALVTESVATAGASASSATTATFIRFFRAWVSSSGTYATQSAGSHAATITIENSAGTEDWGELSVDGFAEAQTNVAAYSVPLGFQAFIKTAHIYVKAAKPIKLVAFHREGILETAAPYSAMRNFLNFDEFEGGKVVEPWAPLGPFPALTDIGFMASVPSATAAVSAVFEIILEKTS